MNKQEKYLHCKSMMMLHLSFAISNESMQDSIFNLLQYHLLKDFAQAEYFSMTHEQRKDLHTLMIL